MTDNDDDEDKNDVDDDGDTNENQWLLSIYMKKAVHPWFVQMERKYAKLEKTVH